MKVEKSQLTPPMPTLANTAMSARRLERACVFCVVGERTAIF